MQQNPEGRTHKNKPLDMATHKSINISGAVNIKYHEAPLL